MKKLGPLENFLISILAYHVTPMLPIIIETSITGRVSDSSLTITTAIYAAGMLACSRKAFLMGVYILISLIQTALYGALSFPDFTLGNSRTLTIISLVFVLITQVFERYQIHILSGRQFWDS